MRINPKNQLDLNKANLYFEKLINNGWSFDLTKVMPARTIPLNSYLHVCLSLYSIEFGYTLEESKTYFKRRCAFMVYEKNGEKFLKKTSKLDNNECLDFISFIRNSSAKEGLYIPDPDEYKKNKYEIDKEINKFKKYL